MSLVRRSLLTIFIILLADQLLKFLIKTNMSLYQEIFIFGDWFQIKFIENNGMAFGMDFPGEYGKMALTLFRIVAVIVISFYLRHLIRIKSHPGFIISVSMILAGAAGNIIDSVFYGVLFSESTIFAPALFLPEGGGYSSLLHGKVVDMFYCPVWRGTWPEWVPLRGGMDFEFFRPVFNVADSAISIGVFSILIFQKKYFEPAPVVVPDTEAAD
jgi:signal peptidase II